MDNRLEMRSSRLKKINFEFIGYAYDIHGSIYAISWTFWRQ